MVIPISPKISETGRGRIGSIMSSKAVIVNEPKPTACTFCAETFPSKTRLFQHLCLRHGLEDPKYDNYRTQRVALLIGWISDFVEDDETNDELWLTEDRKEIRVTVDGTEQALLAAIYAVENRISLNDVPISAYQKYPKGYSRCSRSSQRTAFNMGIESTTHGLADIISMTLLRIEENNVEGVKEWIQKVNELLPNNIRVHERYSIPSGANDFNAEITATQRRYEVMLPLSAVISKNVLDIHTQRQGTDLQDSDTKAEVLGIKSEPFDELIPIPSVTIKKHISNAEMDYLFPRDSIQGRERIEYFVAMKKIMKIFNTSPTVDDPHGRRHHFHNFMNGGTTGDESACRRRIDRFYHRQLLSFPEEYGGTWVVFSLSGDDFLIGQVRRIVASVIAIMHGFLPLSYLTEALNSEYTIYLPTAPSWAVTFAECRYLTVETKYKNCCFDPRRDPNSDITYIESWHKKIQHHVASVGWPRIKRWMNKLQERCVYLLSRLSLLQALRSRSLEQLIESYSALTTKTTVPSEYQEVLRLLRVADRSGLWPPSSAARRGVIVDTKDASGISTGGSFSVGCLPRPLAQPKGNAIFPELTVACFRLERILFPHRPPSSTIAINRHAQFKPHRDSGAGNGQSLSLIVALGDFTGGELVIEDEAVDIRYKPVEFDGWSKRHSTLPFYGERYTLVWFSPAGVDPEDMYWLKLDAFKI